MKSAIVLSALAILGIQAQGGPPGESKEVAKGEAKGAIGEAMGKGAKAKGGKGGAMGKGGKGGAMGKGGKGGARGGAKGAKGGGNGFQVGPFLSGIVAQGDLGKVLGGLSAITSEGKVPLGPAPKGCATYEVMIARGTFEPGPFGVIVGDPLMQAVKREMRGENVRGYAVQYPASMQMGSNGASDVVNRVKTKAKECPGMKFALVGYSQGGMVVSSAVGKIPADLSSKVVAMVLYGSGKGGGAASIAQKTLANCAPYDMCGSPSGSAGHFTYGSTGTSWHARSAKYIANAFHGRAQGYKVYTAPQ